MVDMFSILKSILRGFQFREILRIGLGIGPKPVSFFASVFFVLKCSRPQNHFQYGFLDIGFSCD